MDIRNTKRLKTLARQRLEESGEGRRAILIYAGIVLGLGMLFALVDCGLELQISKTSGLSSLSSRTMLSTVQNMLPLIHSGLALCLDLGFLAVMLRIARGQYVSPMTLKLGFDRFWPLLRLTMLRLLICLGIGLASSYLATMIFLMLPASRSYVSLMLEAAGDVSMLNPTLVLDDAMYEQMMSAMAPAMGIAMVIFAIAATPLLFRYRMAEFVLIDKPGIGAFGALRESRRMTKRRCGALLRVDLSLWWYYAATAAASVLGYGNVLLALLGVELPIPPMAAELICYGLYALAQFASCYFLRSRAETVYCLTYDAIRPQERPASGVVLGNIFQM